MAITQDGEPVLIHLPQSEPNDPIARWFAYVTVTGDATGGNVNLRVRLTDKRERYIYNLESFTSYEDGTDPGLVLVTWNLQTVYPAVFIRVVSDCTQWGTQWVVEQQIKDAVSRYAVGQSGAQTVYGAYELFTCIYNTNVNGGDYYLYLSGYAWDRAELRRLGLPPRFP